MSKCFVRLAFTSRIKQAGNRAFARSKRFPASTSWVIRLAGQGVDLRASASLRSGALKSASAPFLEASFSMSWGGLLLWMQMRWNPLKLGIAKQKKLNYKEKMTSPEPTCPQVSKGEVYQAFMRQAQKRAEFQNKGIEMSIHVTSGIAAATAAAWIAMLVNPSAYPDISAIRVIIFCASVFYGFIQSLILTNYIYQTYILHCINMLLSSLDSSSSLTDNVNIPPEQVKESNLVKRLRGWCRSVIDVFQPVVIYVSVITGWLVASVDLILTPQPILPLCWAIVVVAFLWCLLLVLAVFHRKCLCFAKNARLGQLKNRLTSA